MDRLQTSNRSLPRSGVGGGSVQTNRSTQSNARKLGETLARTPDQKTQNTGRDQNLSSLFSKSNSSQTASKQESALTSGELPSTENMKESEKYDLYSGLISDHGSSKAKKQLANGDKVALSLRVKTDRNVNKGKGEYDDRMVLVWKDDKGVKHAKEYKANVDPSGQYEDQGKHLREGKETGVDHNKDGRLDQGRLAEGTYSYNKGTYLNKAAYRATSDQVAERDVDHNGKFDDNATSPEGNYQMHIHIGGENNTYSAGCFTMSPDEHSNFFNDVGNQKTLTNVVVDTESF